MFCCPPDEKGQGTFWAMAQASQLGLLLIYPDPMDSGNSRHPICNPLINDPSRMLAGPNFDPSFQSLLQPSQPPTFQALLRQLINKEGEKQKGKKTEKKKTHCTWNCHPIMGSSCALFSDAQRKFRPRSPEYAPLVDIY